MDRYLKVLEKLNTIQDLNTKERGNLSEERAVDIMFQFVDNVQNMKDADWAQLENFMHLGKFMLLS